MRLADERGISLAAAANLIETGGAKAVESPVATPVPPMSDKDIRSALGGKEVAPTRLGALNPPTRGPLRSFTEEANDPAAMRRVADVRKEDATRRTRSAERAEDEADDIAAYEAAQAPRIAEREAEAALQYARDAQRLGGGAWAGAVKGTDAPYEIEASGGDSAGALTEKWVENVAPRFKKAAGGLLQSLGDQAQSDSGVFMSDKVKEFGGWLATTGKEMGQAGADELQANAPDYGKLGENHPYRYLYDLSNSILDLGLATGASAITRNPTVGAQMLGIQVFGNQYDDSRRAGRSEGESLMDATFMAVAEQIGEAKVIGSFIKPGAGTIGSAIKQGAKSEGLQEMVTGVLQTGYQKGVLNPEMTWAEAGRAVIDSGILGAGAGSTIAAATLSLGVVANRKAVQPQALQPQPSRRERGLMRLPLPPAASPRKTMPAPLRTRTLVAAKTSSPRR